MIQKGEGNVFLKKEYAERKYLSGKDGIVWATYGKRQSEIIHNALLAQDIHSEISKDFIENNDLFLIKVTDQADVKNALNFIWKSSTGLRLKPDWYYPYGTSNTSFEHWLGDNTK